LKKAGHEVVSAFDDCDWAVIDDELAEDSRAIFFNKVLLIQDNNEDRRGIGGEPIADLTIRPHAIPMMAWVESTPINSHISMGMSSYGLDLQRELRKRFNKLICCQSNLLCLGAPGHSSWERCAAGMATLQITWTESQRLTGKACVGWYGNPTDHVDGEPTAYWQGMRRRRSRH
jgi:hypothetical protein